MRSRGTLALAALAFVLVGVAGWLLLSVERLEGDLALAQAALAEARSSQTEAALELARCRVERAVRDALEGVAAPGSASPATDCDCPAPDCPGEAALEPARAEPDTWADDERVRAHLARRIAAVDPDGEMDEATRRTAVDLLAQLRALRAKAPETGGEEGEGEDAARYADSLRESERRRVEEEFADLTGESVGEFLARIAEPSPERARRPGEAEPLLDGAARKRFADEVTRMLGVAEPGSVEVLEGGEWRSE